MPQDPHPDLKPPADDTERSVRRSADTSPLLTVDEVAERLGTPTRFVRRLIAQRRIGFCRVGRYVRIGAGDLADFIDSGRVDPASPNTNGRGTGSSLQGASRSH
jgi:excisionase family DNA binding protein